MTITDGNDLGPYDFGDPKSPTYSIVAELQAAEPHRKGQHVTDKALDSRRGPSSLLLPGEASRPGVRRRSAPAITADGSPAGQLEGARPAGRLPRPADTPTSSCVELGDLPSQRMERGTVGAGASRTMTENGEASPPR